MKWLCAMLWFAALAASADNSAPIRFEAASPDFEVSGKAEGGELVFWLNRYADSEPVLEARIDVDGLGAAAAQPDGSFRLPAPGAAAVGGHSLVFTILAGGKDDLLVANYEVKPPAPAAARASPLVWQPWLGAVGGVALAAAMFFGLRRRRSPAIWLAGAVLLASGSLPDAGAHEGHDHGPPPAPPKGDAPQRLADGSVFLPEVSQRLLNIRTVLPVAGRFATSVEVPGTVAADPAAGGVVAAPFAGRLLLPPKGLPRPGQSVKQGEVLGLLEPLPSSLELGRARADLADLDARAELAARRAAKLQSLVGSLPQRDIDAAVKDAEALERGRRALAAALVPSTLKAPVAGRIGAAEAVAGAVVGEGQVVWRIVDPGSLLVEARVHDPRLAADIGGADAANVPGDVFSLRYLGASASLKDHSLPVLFAVVQPAPPLAVGEPVKVWLRRGTASDGLAVPASAVLREDGQEWVWVKSSALRFQRRQVVASPLDAGRFLITGGLKEGERVVSRGAETLAVLR